MNTTLKMFKHTLNIIKPKKNNYIQSSSFSTIHPSVVIDKTARFGRNCNIEPFVYIGPNVNIGDDADIRSHCSITNCDIGDRVVIHNGTRIGQDGFGFIPASENEPLPQKKPQNLRVIIKDDIEIGANCTIDRGSWRDTVIESGTKFDNMVHIAHNVNVGNSCLFAACAAIAGSSNIGNNVLMGGQSSIADHVNVTSNVIIAGQAGLTKDVNEEGVIMVGTPASNIENFRNKKK